MYLCHPFLSHFISVCTQQIISTERKNIHHLLIMTLTHTNLNNDKFPCPIMLMRNCFCPKGGSSCLKDAQHEQYRISRQMPTFPINAACNNVGYNAEIKWSFGNHRMLSVIRKLH